MGPAPSRRKVALVDWITELWVLQSCLGPSHHSPRAPSIGASSAPVDRRLFRQRLPSFRLLNVICAGLVGNWIFKKKDGDWGCDCRHPRAISKHLRLSIPRSPLIDKCTTSIHSSRSSPQTPRMDVSERGLFSHLPTRHLAPADCS